MKKILLPGLVSALAMLAASFLLGYVMNLLLPSLQTEYENTNVFRPMKDPLMMLFMLNPFLTAFPFAWGWNRGKDKFTGGAWSNALCLTLIVFFISTLPGMFITYTCFVVSFPMVISWLVSSVLQIYVGMLVICGMNK